MNQSTPPYVNYGSSAMRGPGYSQKINSPEFLAAVSKTRKSKTGCAIACIIAPLVILPIYTHFSDDLDLGQGLLIGAVVSAVFLLFALGVSLKSRLEKPWEGVVVGKDQKTIRRRRNNNDEDDRNNVYYEHHSYVYIKKDNGKTHKIDEKTNDPRSFSYHYFKEGDRVRYHARMGLLFPYEKYDKTGDSYVICPFCRSKADINADVCPRCHKPLLN